MSGFRRNWHQNKSSRSVSATEQMTVQQRIINRYLASMKMDDENGFASIEQYERQYYERLYAKKSGTTTVPEQGEGVEGSTGSKLGQCGTSTGGSGNAETGQHVVDTDFLGPSRIAEKTKLCTTENSNTGKNNTDNDDNWVALIIPPDKQYEIWNSPTTWTWNHCNFKD